jgi:hypothetical protein
MLGLLREERIACEPERSSPSGELRPAPPGGAVVRRGIDEEDGSTANDQR